MTSRTPVPTFSAEVDDLRDMAVLLADSAAAHIRRRRTELGVGGGHANGTDVKSSRVDPVTVVDRESEELIRRLVAAMRPGDVVYGEEEGSGSGGGASGDVATGKAAARWIVDPIDGTVNFLYGIPAYGVSVACEVDGVVVAGAVADVAGDRIFHAGRGRGAMLRTADGIDRAIGCSRPEDLAVALVATGFSYDAHRRVEQGRLVTELLADVRDIRRIGSAALDLCLLAAGAVDCYYEHGLNVWDWAAGALIAEEAGAVVDVPGLDALSDAGDVVMASAPAVADDFRAALRSRGALDPMPKTDAGD
ncbi:inositol monophosphatase family protein [uncultured Corynebacterium sp.]|uniref:inositol monophosphatase family protein n=1 Tax=uncultured Corynebacterium sp. TaxID=159447 RepID=UPI0025F330D3|nr:inositol monophosphatase family protein [uncultured Corynebacterium sp.]